MRIGSATGFRLCALCAFLLSFVVPFDASGAELPAPGADLPAVLQKPFAALVGAPASQKDRACDALIDSYIPLLRSGKSIPLVDQTIVSSISIEGRAALAARLAIAGVFSALQEACIEQDSRESLTGLQADLIESAKELYRALETLSRAERPQPVDWAHVAASLRAGWRYFPSPLYAGQLEAALRQSHNRRGLFEFKAYRYFDESGPIPFRVLGLFLQWLFLPDKMGFGKEIALIKKSIKNDISRTSPGVAGLPRFGGETFLTGQGAARPLAFSDPGSELYQKRAVFAFFDTTCSYCVDELRALGGIVRAREAKSRVRLTVIGMKVPSTLPPAISALAPFERGLALPFPLLESPTSALFSAYGVRSVPLLVFFDENGVPLWTVAFRGRGRLEEKLSWFVDDFLADAQPARADAIERGTRPIPVDFYYDPSRADCQAFIETNVPALERSLGVTVEMVSHDLRSASVSNALENRLIALRTVRSEPVVAILGTRAIQGLAAMKRDLPGAVAAIASSQSRRQR